MPHQPLLTGYSAMLLLSSVSALAASSAGSPASHEICPTVTIVGDLRLDLSDTEKRLVCGDPKSEAWKVIPPPQAQFQMKGFLQERGFFRPKFTEEKDRITVDLGEVTHVTSVSAPGSPPELDLGRKRDLLGATLTPTFLDQQEKWIVRQLQNNGYPCPEAHASADAVTGAVTVQVWPGPQQRVLSLVEDMAPGLLPNVLRRYDAFHTGDYFSTLNLQVTSNRIQSAGLFDSASFDWKCTPEGVALTQSVVTGPPRLLTFGIGANTEGILIGKANWKNSRMGLKASLLNVDLYASFIEQRATAYLQAYVFDAGSRQSIKPLFQIDRDIEPFYTTTTTTAQLSWQTTWDTQTHGGSVQIGPNFQYIHTETGTGPPDSRFLELMLQTNLMSHNFEYFRPVSIEGHQVSLAVYAANRSFGSTATEQRLSLRAEKIWNFRSYDPPLWVFGIRGGLDATFTPQTAPGTTQYTEVLPVNFLHFLGGSQTLRGFGRNELPTDGIGRLSSFYIGTEFRFSHFLPFNLEPFLFFDIGALGMSPLAFDPPFYTSPGIGLRWTPVFGVFRATLGHGYPASTPGHYQFYLSFGEDF